MPRQFEMTTEQERRAYALGKEDGIKDALDHLNAGTQGIIDCLRIVREGVKNGVIHARSADAGEVWIPLDEYINSTLRAAGIP